MFTRLFNPLHDLLETLLGFLTLKIYLTLALILKDLGNCDALNRIPVFLIELDAVDSDWSKSDLSGRGIESDCR